MQNIYNILHNFWKMPCHLNKKLISIWDQPLASHVGNAEQITVILSKMYVANLKWFHIEKILNCCKKKYT